MIRGVCLVIVIVASSFGLGCRSKPIPSATSNARAVAAAPAPIPSLVNATPSAAPSAVSEAERVSPLSSAAPIVPKAERDAAVELCCKLFDPYVTGCVRPQGVCPHRMKGHCEQAWKRGATLADIEPGLRRLAPLEGYFVPPQCMASAAARTSAGN
jgi:hypothetical protein